MGDIAVRAERISKQYRIGAQAPYRTLRETLAEAAAAPFKRLRGRRHSHKGEAAAIWALKDISFEVRQGDVVGIIGRNGAGKSTILKILSRITEPTSGYADLYGRVGSLLEVGTGFHAELTGRENIYLNGAILGMKRAEIHGKFDEIVSFAEVERFVDTPVKHYSSGMYLRLAFAVAAHLEPEVLIIDEVLAVGDLAFQKKCSGKMGDVARQGRTVLFVSHNMAAVRQLCSSALLLNAGRIVASGKTEDVVRSYMAAGSSGVASDLSHIADRKGAGDVRFQSVRLEFEDGQETSALACGQSGAIVLGVRCRRPLPRIRISLTFYDTLDQRIMHLDSKLLGADLPEAPTDGELVCEIPRVHLAPGRYRIELWLQSAGELQDWVSDAGRIDVIDGNFFGTGKALADGFQVAVMDFRWISRDARQEVPSLAACSRNGSGV
jgi:lipopolysaccharide transport system ATP-binding protein